MKREAELGKQGEELALRYLEGLGLRLRERNWRHSHLEVDLIMQSPGRLHIVEVKTLKAPVRIQPWEQVDRAKQSNLIKAASRYISQSHFRGEVQFDIVSIVIEGEGARIEYIPEAFIPIIY